MEKRRIPVFIVEQQEIDRCYDDKSMRLKKGEPYSELDECVCGSKIFFLEKTKRYATKDNKRMRYLGLENHCAICGRHLGGWEYDEQTRVDDINKG